MGSKKNRKQKKSVKDRDKKPVGRPPWEPSNDLLEKIEENAGLGLFDYQIAAVVGINPKLFSEYKQRHESIRDALERGRALAIVQYSKDLKDQSRLGKTAATLFFLRVHGGWRDNAAISRRSDEGSNETLSKRILDIVRRNRERDGGGSSEESTQGEVQN